MEGPRQTRRLWTREEDDKLKEVRRKNPKLSWSATAKEAGLDRSGEKCWERWKNKLNPDIKKGEFSLQEDELIMRLKSEGVSWATMEKNYLHGRAANAIKNRWNNHLKKTPKGTMILRLKDLMDDEASDHSVPEDDLKARMAEFQSIVRGDDLEASTSGSADLIHNHDPNALHSITETFTR